MKFKVVFSILILIIIATFAYAISLSLKLVDANEELSEKIDEIEDAKLKYASLEEKAKADLEACLNEGDRSKWEIATRTNTLKGYSSYMDNCNEAEGNCNKEALKKAINTLLNAKGYVQMVETNGNKLYSDVDLNLDGRYIKFKTDKAVRNGAIGIRDCGVSPPKKTGGIVLKGKVVKVLGTCKAAKSESVWVHIQYAR